MISVVGEKGIQLEALFRRHGVRRLELFGSATDGTFNMESSDLDVLVPLKSLSPGEHYEGYLGLWKGLQALFQRRIELVEEGAMRIPYFIRRVNESRKQIYAA